MAQFFRVLYPKISTGQEKLALTGLHGLHVFATLVTEWSHGYVVTWLHIHLVRASQCVKCPGYTVTWLHGYTDQKKVPCNHVTL